MCLKVWRQKTAWGIQEELPVIQLVGITEEGGVWEKSSNTQTWYGLFQTKDSGGCRPVWGQDIRES